MSISDIYTPIIQFGTSRFLQAHADLFIDEALREGNAVGAITVVQSSGDAVRAKRLAALAVNEGFPVRIRGLEKGVPVDRTQMVRSVRRTLSTTSEWDTLTEIFCDQAEYVLSNTGDRGFTASNADTAVGFNQAMSYPAKLQQLLRARYDNNNRPLIVMPLELVMRNGEVLKKRVLELACQAPVKYQRWLSTDVIWVNSLVDRIVSEPLLPAGAVAEPYAQWAIEKAPGATPPCAHPAVLMVDDLAEIEALKLFILNLGHTWLASLWQQKRQPPIAVSAFLAEADVYRQLQFVYDSEVLPTFEQVGLGEKAMAYRATTFERFQNPFLEHCLSDIAQNHAEKIKRRVGGFLEWANTVGDTKPKPLLTALLHMEKNDA